MELNTVTPSISVSDVAVSQTIYVASHTPVVSTPIDVRNSVGLDYLNHASFNDTPATDHVTSPSSVCSDSKKVIEVRKSDRCPRKKNLSFEYQSSKLSRQKSGTTSVSLLSPSSSCLDTSNVVSRGFTDLSALYTPGDSHEVSDELYLNYRNPPEKWLLGDLLWAKVSGHPWWPCIVAVDPILSQHTRVYRRNVRQYYVQFYGDECHYAWINEPATMQFHGRSAYDEVRVNATKKQKQLYEVSKHRVCAWNIAVAAAEEALSKDKSCRLTESASRYTLGDDTSAKPVIKSPKRKYTKRKLEDVIDLEMQPSKRHKLDGTCDTETCERPVLLRQAQKTDQERNSAMEHESDYSDSPTRILPTGAKRSERIATSHIICARQLLGKKDRQSRSKAPVSTKQAKKELMVGGKNAELECENNSSKLSQDVVSKKNGIGAEEDCNVSKARSESLNESDYSEIVPGAVKMYTVDAVESPEDIANRLCKSDIKLTLQDELVLKSDVEKKCLGSIIIFEPVEIKSSDCSKSCSQTSRRRSKQYLECGPTIVEANPSAEMNKLLPSELHAKCSVTKVAFSKLDDSSAKLHGTMSSTLETESCNYYLDKLNPLDLAVEKSVAVAKLSHSRVDGTCELLALTSATLDGLPVHSVKKSLKSIKTPGIVDSEEATLKKSGSSRGSILEPHKIAKNRTMRAKQTSSTQMKVAVVWKKKSNQLATLRTSVTSGLQCSRPSPNSSASGRQFENGHSPMAKNVVHSTKPNFKEKVNDAIDGSVITFHSKKAVEQITDSAVSSNNTNGAVPKRKYVRKSFKTESNNMHISVCDADVLNHISSDIVGKTSSDVTEALSKPQSEEVYDGNSKQESLTAVKVCRVCEMPTEHFVLCSGPCLGVFHATCVGTTADANELYRCSECITGIRACFTCKRSDSSVVQCAVQTCGRFYHTECIGRVTGLGRRDIGGSSSRLVCSLHTCASCTAEAAVKTAPKMSKGTLYQCVRCPTAYHASQFCVAAGTKLIVGNSILCAEHTCDEPDSSVPNDNFTWCTVCSREDGTLVNCSSCPAAVHGKCVKNGPSDGTSVWQCHNCVTGKQPFYGEIVWAKVGNYRWWPAEICSLKSMSSPSILELPHSDCHQFVVRLLGCGINYWITRCRVYPFTEHDKLCHETTSWRLEKLYKQAVTEAATAWHKWTTGKAQQKEVNPQKLNRKPPPYKHVKLHVPMAGVEIFRASLDELPRCQCNPSAEQPCGLNSDCLNRLLMYECHPLVCPAGDRCCNQSFQRREDPDMEPFFTGNRGWGLRTKVNIRKGQFISEYVGDLINIAESRRRLDEANRNNIANFYMMTLDDTRIIDAGPKGNFTRFMNNSCQPNCETQKWSVNGDVRIGLFACMDISAGVELTFNYNMDCFGGERFACKCNAENCSGFLGLRPKTAAAMDAEHRSKRAEYNRMQKKLKKTSKASVVAICMKCYQSTSGGRVIVCSHMGCGQTYHRSCVNPTGALSQGAWMCPNHLCKACSGVSAQYCSICPSSYCIEHATAYLVVCSDDKFCCNTHNNHGLDPSGNKSMMSKCDGIRLKCKKGKSRLTSKECRDGDKPKRGRKSRLTSKECRDGDKPKRGRKSLVNGASNRSHKSAKQILKIVLTSSKKKK